MDITSLDTPVLVSGAVLILVFFIGLSQGRKTWLHIDFLATAVFGLAWYFIPQVLLGLQINGEPDGTHLTYTRAFGAVMIGDAVARYFIRSSKDNSAQVFLLLSRVIGCAILLIAMIYIQITGNNVWNQNHIFFGMLGNVLWMVGSAVFFAQSRFSGGHAQLESRLNFHLRMDGFLILLTSSVLYAFPDVFLKIQTTLSSYDNAHLHMVRSIGALMFGSAILSFLAPGFLFDWDKRALLAGRVVKILITVLAVFYATAKYDGGWGKNLHVYLLLEGSLVLNALLGYYAPHETERYKTN